MIINILLCDTFPGLLPSSIPSYEYMFRKLFDSVLPAGKKITYSIYDTYKEELPDTLHQDQLYLITGSNSGAYEDKRWIRKLLDFIRKAHKEKVPLAGICFGHQAIAQALGGRVEPALQGWGTGIRRSAILHPQGLLYFPDGQLSLHYNHHDQVMELPPEAIQIATSNFCLYEGFIIGNHVLTFQGHPEYEDHYNIHLLENHAEGESEEVIKAGLESIQQNSNKGQNAARWILSLIR